MTHAFPAPINAVAVSAAQGVAVTGGADGVLRSFDLATGEPKETFVRAEHTAVLAVAIGARGCVVSSAADGSVLAWTLGGSEGWSIMTLPRATTALAFLDGENLLTAERSRPVIYPVFEREGRAVTPGLATDEPLRALVPSADGTAFLAVGREVKVWSLANSEERIVIAVAGLEPSGAAWLDDRTCLVAFENGALVRAAVPR